MGNKIQRIYVGSNLVRPSATEITETYTAHSPNGTYSIYKSGYKVKSLVMEWEGYYALGNWYETDTQITGSSAIFGCVCSLGGTYGYPYGNGQGEYGGIRLYYNSAWNGLVLINSTSTTSTQNAGKIILDTEKADYSIGKTYGTWLQTGTYTFNSTEKQQIEALFGDGDISYQTLTWNNNTDTYNFVTITVTYESV